MSAIIEEATAVDVIARINGAVVERARYEVHAPNREAALAVVNALDSAMRCEFGTHAHTDDGGFYTVTRGPLTFAIVHYRDDKEVAA